MDNNQIRRAMSNWVVIIQPRPANWAKTGNMALFLRPLLFRCEEEKVKSAISLPPYFFLFFISGREENSMTSLGIQFQRREEHRLSPPFISSVSMPRRLQFCVSYVFNLFFISNH
ncbi:hypothetical protein DM860_007735 [Cuscuta australis]|uniref:Uncharacterized protein n=1 Tax=Cuscuta australis TaxID=267555 RepID=A0A328E4T4_9ASTE|nr:hypothetical protein DM860_007735 [Cuscuta australis]